MKHNRIRNVYKIPIQFFFNNRLSGSGLENIVFPSGEFPKDRFLILKPSNHTRLTQNHSKSHTKIEFDQRHGKILKILIF